MMPSDAYEQRVKHYHSRVRELEQFGVIQPDPRPTARRRLSFVTGATFRFVVLFLGFVVVALIAYA